MYNECVLHYVNCPSTVVFVAVHVTLCPIHTADTDETQLSSFVASAVCIGHKWQICVNMLVHLCFLW